MATSTPSSTSQDSGPLWRAPALLRAAGETLRPGGFALTDRACELAGLLPGWPVLDVGCGRGATVLRLRTRYGAQALGVDPDPVLDTVGNPGAVPYMVRGTAQALPFDSGSFRMLTCECVLSLVQDPAQALAEFHRVLQPGGVLALSDLYLRQTRSGPDCNCNGPAHSTHNTSATSATATPSTNTGITTGTAPTATGTTPTAATNDQRAPQSTTTAEPSAAASPSETNTTSATADQDTPFSCAPFSCADGAMTRDDLEAHLARAGFRLHLFEDHSPLLRGLAANLIWQGLSPACAPQTAPTGYCLILAVADHP